MEKICRIVNERFSWIMYVDDKMIPFQLAFNADYFADHYKKLGYTIIREKAE